MKINKFYIFPILHIIAVYFFVTMPGWLPTEDALWYMMGYLAIVGVMNIIACKKYCKAENEIVLLRATILVKYALIPLYIMGSVVAMGLLLLTFIPVPIMIFLGPGGAFLLSVFGWIILVLSAPYSISYLHSSRKAGKRHKLVVWLHTILQFFFVLDILDVMFLSIKEKVWRKLSIGLLVVFALAAVVGFCAVVGGIVKLVMG